MLIKLDQVLDTATLQAARQALQAAHWQDGAATAGSLARHAKANQQLDDADPLARQLGEAILQRLARHPGFLSAALPRHIHPPKFNRYTGGGHYGTHVDSAVMQLPGGAGTMRCDLSCTLFLEDPAAYDGGELEVEDTYGPQRIKLPAGSAVLYPSASLHRVTPVTRGARLASFFWVQSLVADDGQRVQLWDLDQAIQALQMPQGGHPALQADDPRLLKLTGTYHNLLRRWAQP